MPGNTYQDKKAFFARVLTVYGRNPVLEALRDPSLQCHALHLADTNREGQVIGELRDQAAGRDIPVKYHSRPELSRISKNGKQDQGVALDIVCPSFSSVEDHLQRLRSDRPQTLLALDGISNPQNLGMILRSAVAGDIDGIIWSPRGNAALGPLVIKASAGTLYRAPLLIATELSATLQDYQQQGAQVCTLEAGAQQSLFDHRPDSHCIFVLGNETTGVSSRIRELADIGLSIPMARGVESLNVAVTAGLIAYASRIDPHFDK